MSIWRAILGMASVRWWMYLLSGLFASGIFYVFPLIPGLVVRQFLNDLSDGAQVGPSLWLPLALLLAVAVVRAPAT